MKNKGINENTRKELFKYKHKIYLKTDKNLSILFAIDNYTLKKEGILQRPINKINEIAFKIKTNNITYNSDTKMYEYKEEKMDTYHFDTISRYIFENNEIKNELETKKRYRKCHMRSIDLALAIGDAKVVTGIAKLNGVEFLHSIVEIMLDNKTLYLDWTRNIMMPQDEYKRLFRYREISKVDAKNIISDIEYIRAFNLNIEEYLLFRDELMKDVEKNKSVFQKVKVNL